MKNLLNPRVWLLLIGVIVAAGVGYVAAEHRPTVKSSIDPIIDLDADKGVEATADGQVDSWKSQADWKVNLFKAVRKDGHPVLRKNVDAINGHNSLIFDKKELLNDDEDAFDHLSTGNGYTWITVVAVHQQVTMEPDVDVIFGNLKNGPHFEGFWAGVSDDNHIWCGSRNGKTFGRWDANNPGVTGPKLEENRFCVIAGRMGAGTGTVNVELFVNDTKPVSIKPFPVNPDANPSMMAIGEERNAVNHPGREAFKGEIARIIFWDRPLSDDELGKQFDVMTKTYGVK